ncbi:MAG: Malic enzyme [Parcubacteria group bacterium GW2011_GWB1_38_8]|uniref:Malate dehydrogenase n=1 Tax=Candidatus Zambryskibacteria bacterium RIFCSPLOWO2_02_FULL_39_14 TaxID=1802769 RepID=A0A1G2UHY5_9BACT|nr:MAG: Malic enzyme [Parcubacteria group bacterium GW2011_GWB1_38_8]OHA95893.1 MAG: malate dehydrogenase [Candidatus Zambryskibacteria bacterium RIFCSPHIGHO2_02_FULL_39_16]OHB09015.1 MAG: malate dehydrogenase [Candidatus Zambryskibacteria bacterium RIFCSPLOWO2_02_FULL_39_14]
MKKDYQKLSIKVHKKTRGKLEIVSRIPINNRNDLSIAYTPGVAGPALAIARNKKLAYDLTSTKNGVAIISDGSAVLGLGNIGPEAALPIMEGKAVLFKRFANIDAFPIVLSTQNSDEIVVAVKAIAPTFGGINLEDISAPRCFEIENRLKEELSIPVMHDDQHGTAVVVLAGLINALKVVGKKKEFVSVVINGAGAAGVAITKLLYLYGIHNMVICDSKGIVEKKRQDLTPIKKELIKITNKKNLSGSLTDAIKDADIFIGVSKGNLLKPSDIKTMTRKAIVFAMANPTPEIMPDKAKLGGAVVVASGRSDFPNQINNVLVFPGIFKGAIESRTHQITDDMKIAAALALAAVVKKPTANKIIPYPFDKRVVASISNAIKKLAMKKP